MSNTERIEGTVEAWEAGLLGLDEQFVSRVELKLEAQIEEASGMQAISIRLDRGLIESFKALAEYHGISGYQPLMRDVLQRFADSEMKSIAMGVIQSQKKISPSTRPGHKSPKTRKVA